MVPATPPPPPPLPRTADEFNIVHKNKRKGSIPRLLSSRRKQNPRRGSKLLDLDTPPPPPPSPPAAAAGTSRSLVLSRRRGSEGRRDHGGCSENPFAVSKSNGLQQLNPQCCRCKVLSYSGSIMLRPPPNQRRFIPQIS